MDQDDWDAIKALLNMIGEEQRRELMGTSPERASGSDPDEEAAAASSPSNTEAGSQAG